MEIVIWVFFGIAVGIFSTLIEKESKKNIMSSILLGISGALLGGFLASIIFSSGISGFNLNALIVAMVGSFVLLYIGREIKNI